jgi:uncharacterized protein (TIGR01319 family)
MEKGGGCLKNMLLIDFGSTYTKITAVDLDAPKLLGTARALTTIKEGIEVGLRQAEGKLQQLIGEVKFDSKLACSSAAGGLRMVAIGLVPELTVEAARRAALGAGARVVGAYGYQLTSKEVDEIIQLRPDLLILAGGTDGGDTETIIHNSRVLASSSLTAPIILAGNKTVAAEVADLLQAKGKTCYLTPNVLPGLGRLNIEPVQEAIRRIFLERIIYAKGLDRVLNEIDGVMMPTPAAALAAAKRLSDGNGLEAGMGELILVDVGGATTDLHSVANGLPTKPEVSLRGLPEPRVKRTVEGDLGMRYSAASLVEAFGIQRLEQVSGLPADIIREGVNKRIKNVSMVPVSTEDSQLEQTIGFLAVKGAMDRHVGILETVYSPFGVTYIQTGKDLTGIKHAIGAGGVLVAQEKPEKILRGVLFEANSPELLKPISPQFWLDSSYVLTTLGLLAQMAPEESYLLLRKAIALVPRSEEVKEETP